MWTGKFLNYFRLVWKTRCLSAAVARVFTRKKVVTNATPVKRFHSDCFRYIENTCYGLNASHEPASDDDDDDEFNIKLKIKFAEQMLRVQLQFARWLARPDM